MQIKQTIGTPVRRIVSLANLTTGAILEPLSFKLDRATGLIAAVRKERLEERAPDGIGANVITFSKGRLGRRLLAIYKAADGEWMFFDGKHEYHLEAVVFTWKKGVLIIPGVFSLAILELNCAGVVSSVNYFRPYLRYWSEGGWALEDIDIGHLIARLSKNPAGRARLDDALKMGQALP